MQTDPILIIGAGAIGAIVGVHLIRAGHTVHFAEVNAEHVASIRANGLRLSGALDQTVQVPIMLPSEVREHYPVVLLAVKAPHTLDALPTVEAALAPMVGEALNVATAMPDCRRLRPAARLDLRSVSSRPVRPGTAR